MEGQPAAFTRALCGRWGNAMYCSGCGVELKDGAKYCPSCGMATALGATPKAEAERQETWEGTVRKCPVCGEILPSFTATCPACGYELREAAASASVREFSDRLASATDPSMRAGIIEAFPVPNTREDIAEFLIMAAANVESCDNDKEFHAWRAKLDQCSHKARMILSGAASDQADALIAEAERSVDEKLRAARIETVERFVTRTAGIFIGAALMFTAAMIDLSGENSSLMEFGGMMIFLVSAAIAGFGGLGAAGTIACFASGAYSFALGSWYASCGGNGSLYTLGGGLIVVASVLSLFRLMLGRPRRSS